MNTFERETNEEDSTSPLKFAPPIKNMANVKDRAKLLPRAKRHRRLQGFLTMKKSKPMDLKNKTMRDRLEEKMFYYYGNYSTNGFTFDEHMGFEEIGQELFNIDEGNGLRKRKIIPKNDPNWSRIADLILRWKGKSFARALKRINHEHSLLNQYDSTEFLRDEGYSPVLTEQKSPLELKKSLKDKKELSIEIGNTKKDIREVISKCIYNKVEHIRKTRKTSVYQKVTHLLNCEKKEVISRRRRPSSLQPRQRDIRQLSSRRIKKLKEQKKSHSVSKKKRQIYFEGKINRFGDKKYNQEIKTNKFLDISKVIARNKAYERRSALSNYSVKRKKKCRKFKNKNTSNKGKDLYNDSSYVVKTTPKSIKLSGKSNRIRDFSTFQVESLLDTYNPENRPNTGMRKRDNKEASLTHKGSMYHKMLYLQNDQTNSPNTRDNIIASSKHRKKSTHQKKVQSFKVKKSCYSFKGIRKSVFEKNKISLLSDGILKKRFSGYPYSAACSPLKSYHP
ncbi:unnamed protein product [Moneuplotes crassus]|uniref:Uncharacterized protein n=1 Tax=Euplotes crassus TaxID=5936 RepID=A0AAD1XBU5_EUPCR|nr:unnamed protein product [Moneuplotes crassus]